MTNRRKFLIGMGSLAAGGIAAFGSGATSITNADRNVDINVVADDYGVLALEDTSQGDIVNQNGKKLEIDFAEYSGSAGVSLGAELIIGEVSLQGSGDIGEWGYAQKPAFQIRNQAAGNTFDLDFKYELENPDSLNSNGSVLGFYNFHNTHYSPLRVYQGSPEDVGGGAYEQTGFLSNYDGLEPGQAVNMAIAIDTDNPNSATSEDLSGNLTIEATPH
jgi:hypothetical protein